jgi:hypothetical protein
MLKTLYRWLYSLFEPGLEMLANMPPQLLRRTIYPF